MIGLTKDTRLIENALNYVIEVYRELSAENGAPTAGTQNQAVEFILADAERSRSVAEWARRAPTDEATTAPPQRLPYDATYRQVAGFLRQAMETSGFERKYRD
jgi:hypothetical protein